MPGKDSWGDFGDPDTGTNCPHCARLVSDRHLGEHGYYKGPRQDGSAEKVEELRAWCIENGHQVYPGDLVARTAAATLMGYSPDTLRNWSSYGGAVQVRRIGGKVRFALQDIAEKLAG